MSSYILWFQYKLTKKGFTGGLLPSLDLKRCCVTEPYHMPQATQLQQVLKAWQPVLQYYSFTLGIVFVLR